MKSFKVKAKNHKIKIKIRIYIKIYNKKFNKQITIKMNWVKNKKYIF